MRVVSYSKNLDMRATLRTVARVRRRDALSRRYLSLASALVQPRIACISANSAGRRVKKSNASSRVRWITTSQKAAVGGEEIVFPDFTRNFNNGARSVDFPRFRSCRDIHDHFCRANRSMIRRHRLLGTTRWMVSVSRYPLSRQSSASLTNPFCSPGQ